MILGDTQYVYELLPDLKWVIILFTLLKFLYHLHLGNSKLYLVQEYLSRFKGMILTCNGLGIGDTSIWYFSSDIFQAHLTVTSIERRPALEY